MMMNLTVKREITGVSEVKGMHFAAYPGGVTLRESSSPWFNTHTVFITWDRLEAVIQELQSILEQKKAL